MWNTTKYPIPILAPEDMLQHEQDAFRLYIIGKLATIFINHNPKNIDDWNMVVDAVVKHGHAEFMSLLNFRKKEEIKKIDKQIERISSNVNNLHFKKTHYK